LNRLPADYNKDYQKINYTYYEHDQWLGHHSQQDLAAEDFSNAENKQKPDQGAQGREFHGCSFPFIMLNSPRVSPERTDGKTNTSCKNSKTRHLVPQ
jgi:hypothetical protein